MTPAERITLRTVCEQALERAKGKTCQPVVMLPAAMVLALLDASQGDLAMGGEG
ncbi:hypothetical protein [Roseomonas xinghualingensis]|uniref:hypothetical protein n=1 Tax=Roseomonas xinghualingensis TaxID=2986475 RepID=UPI0021F1ED43|nr:hypothetical protein [Roseomonas sp. SXEYE001]MCV4209877.1 hypothetical protein [Roseomonas sp. SXEYE001]